ncbi:MAG: putative transaldolase [Syntrophorhabdaceae bacterium PtaU1.Bin034]|jgi:transaldolase|nr:MAG: putative transaldolase [Syntrophorhabdaceae bacterium PtaU1.Bin034]
MRPENLKTRIFLDGANPEETREAINILGFLDGQTTNPTLMSKNPGVRERLEKGEKFAREEITDYYRDVVRQISAMIPKGSISIEVYADAVTTAEKMLEQGREMFGWIPNGHIKFPTSTEGLKAASQALKEGLRVNMTLCFSQDQAAAVYAATKGARREEVFVSPFIGRLDDRGENGMDVIAHIIRMYRDGDGHVEVLTASVRNLDHILCAIQLGSDIITAPFNILKEWGEKRVFLPGPDYRYDPRGLKPIPYEEVDLVKDWRDYHIRHDLTDKGMEKFSQDWNSLIR